MMAKHGAVMHPVRPSRRSLLALAGSAALLPLAACVSVLPEQTARGAASKVSEKTVASLRSANGLSGMKPDRDLEKAALEQASFMLVAGKMDHTALAGHDFEERMTRRKVQLPAAENLAHGRMPMEKVFDMWMNSEGHRRNLLDPRFARFGLGYVDDKDGRRYWAMVLGA